MVLQAIQTIGATYYRIKGIIMLISGIIAMIVGAIIALASSVPFGLIIGAIGILVGIGGWLYFISAKRIENGLPPLIRTRHRIRMN
ncbi:hypothetical protein CMI46_00365 [Candidatus Pacearchaeota archaeon]|nr:hypothetical protein [Candidatus Pacearchaeota archaeon]|tara:strand:- start:29829 stop:30086 length:258 start_codon:yes stop_codon:yes gene_type:complete